MIVEKKMTETIYICASCHSEMYVTFGGWPSRGKRIICPGTGYIEHSRLQLDILGLERLNEQIHDYKDYIKERKDDEEVKNELSRLNAQKKVLEFKIQNIREKFSRKLKSDIEFANNKNVNLEYIISYSEIAFPNLHLD